MPILEKQYMMPLEPSVAQKPSILFSVGLRHQSRSYFTTGKKAHFANVCVFCNTDGHINGNHLGY
jgi:hypothetical protein